MIRGTGYIIGRLKGAQDPKILRCKSVDEVDECHREVGIMHGYRYENCSVLQAMASVFMATNETVNFWTHFLPTLYFVWLFTSLSYSMPLFSDPYLFPFVCYMSASCAYPLVSCLAHAFSCLSTTAAHVGFFLDYATISLYSWGAAILYYSYCFPTVMIKSPLTPMFLPVAFINSILATLISCSSRFVSSPIIRKLLRLGGFVLPYAWVSWPLAWRLITCDPSTDSCGESGFYHSCQFFGVFLASFFYATHIPERLAPGRFDIVGHSHNFLHLFGIAATYQQIQGSLLDLNTRRSYFESIDWTTASSWTIIATPLIVFTNLCLVIFFARRLIKIAKESPVPLPNGIEKKAR